QNTVAWLPLAFWAAHELLSRPRLKALLAFAAVYGLQILSGHLEIVYFESLLLLAYGCFLLPGLPKPAWRPVLLLVAALGLGIGLSAIQLFPAFAYLPDSVRQQGIRAVDAQTWSVSPYLTPLLLLPEQAGNIFEGTSLNMIFGEKDFGYTLFFLSIYLGVMVWVLVLVGLSLPHRLEQRGRFLFFSGAFGLCLLLAYGKFLPLYKLLLALPGAGFFRYPSKLLVFASFALVLAAGGVLEQALREPALVRRLVHTSLALAGAALLGCLLLLPAGEAARQLVQTTLQTWRTDIRPENVQRWADAFVALLRQQLLVFAALTLLTAGLWQLYRQRGSRPALACALLLLTAVGDLLANGINTLWMCERTRFESDSDVARQLRRLGLDQQPQARMMLANEYEYQELPDSFEPELMPLINFRPIYYQHQAMVNNYSLKHGFRNVYAYWPGRSRLSNDFYVGYQQALLSGQTSFRQAYETLNSARYLLTVNPPPELAALYQNSPDYHLVRYFPDTNVTIWENLHWLPRARFQYQALTVSQPEQMLTAMSGPAGTGYDPQQHVLLLDDQRLAEAKAQVPASEAKIKHWSEPQFLVEGNNRVEIGFETNTSGYLVLADQNLPGWRAWDNGRPVPILLANYLQRALRVGPGKHRIVFAYRPPGFRAGWITTLIAGGIWLLLLWRCLDTATAANLDMVAAVSLVE
ncbi:MAG TPA: YfhO family protein, partial [Candidatus Obscuribacterales bacterium]